MPDDTGEKQIEEGAGNDELATLRTELEGLKSKVEESETANTELKGKLERADELALNPDYLEYLDAKNAPVAPAGEAEVDFDLMTNAQIAAHIKGQSDVRFDALRTLYDESRKADHEGLTAAFGQIQLALTALEYPELKEGLKDETYTKEFYALSKQNPTWTAEALYKHISMQKKVAAQEKIESDKVRQEEQLQVVAGKGGAPTSTLAAKHLSRDEAGEAAYQVAFGTHGPAKEM